MQRLKKGLASLLAVLLLASVLPAAAMAEETDGNAAEEVVFNLGTMEVTVGSDREKYEEGEVPYDLFDEDGNYTMDLGPDVFFPYEVQFTCGGATWTEWFMDADDTVEVGGHIFSVETYVSDPAALTGLSFEIGGRTVIAYPEEKEFTNDGPGIALWSLLPIKENRNLTLDMRGYLPDELKNVPVSAVLSGASITAGASDLVVWSKAYNSDDYTIVGQDGTMDLAPEDQYNSSHEMELIVGTGDQLDISNIRYILSVEVTPSDELFDVVAYSSASPRQPIAVYDTYLWEQNSEQTILEIGVDPTAWAYGDLAYLSLSLNGGFNSTGLTTVVYQGLYESEEAAVAANAPVIDDIWDQTAIAAEGGHLADYGWKQNYQGMPEITVVLKRGDSVALIRPMILYMYEDEMNISVSGLYAENGGDYHFLSYDGPSTWDNVLGMQVRTITLENGYPANGTYYLRMNLRNPAVGNTDNHGIAYVRHAAVGNYSTAAQIQTQPDIKAQLFSDTGYSADYSAGVVFSVLDTNGDIHRVKIVTSASESAELAPEPQPDSPDTYFRMDSAKAVNGENTQNLNCYVMPYEHDGYYYNGYQTVFLLNSDNTPVTADEIVPVFTTGTGVTAYAGLDKASGDRQVSGTTAIPFRSGEPVHYSASAESKGHLKNYWVTFLTQQAGGPKLFVNAANDPDRVDEESGLPVREVYLTEEFGKHQDVFFANIGDAPMTGVYVRLEDAVNVKLDDYWTVREDAPAENKILGAFDSTYDRAPDDSYVSYGELANVAKVRLVPTDSEGSISGTLVIGHDGGEEVRIKLTGASGPLKITTETIRNGVKYVPFNSVIQTNSMGASDAVKFTWTGKLPTGVKLQPNGKLYGVPLEAGTFTFTATATFNNDPALRDSKTFTIKILDSTKTNVDNATDAGYELQKPVEDITVTDNTGVYDYQNDTFISKGEYSEFHKVFLDGRELVEGTDFVSESGSTKITIQAQTFRNAGGGTHVIAAEFRSDKNDTNTVKVTAQTYTVTIRGGGSSGGGSTKPSVKPQTPDKTKPETAQPGSAAATFRDVSSGNWFFADVEWAYQNRLMIGVTKDLYKPYNPISPAMVVTVLSRMDKVDLSQYADTSYEEIAGGQWYTAAAAWAKEAGLLPEGPFVAQPPMGRGQMAVMLVKYLKHAGIDCTLVGEPVVFTDADLMTPEENEAFQVLYQFGIFKGIGNYTMDVAGATTRAQLAVLIHRLSVFVESHKK